jgi:5-formyltetrahydrofolate cyclo-ligase
LFNVSQLKTDKQHLRREIGERLKNNPRKGDGAAGMAARDHFFKHFSALDPKTVVGVTLPMPEELDTQPLINALATKNFTLALPVMVGKGAPLIFRRYTPGDALEKKIWDIREPLASASEIVPNFVLTPLVAFDRKGNRLGHGAGYYDFTLKHLRQSGRITACGFCWALQEVPEVPIGSIDQPLDLIITEASVILPPARQV